jgi:hypothetical protein
MNRLHQRILVVLSCTCGGVYVIGGHCRKIKAAGPPDDTTFGRLSGPTAGRAASHRSHPLVPGQEPRQDHDRWGRCRRLQAVPADVGAHGRRGATSLGRHLHAKAHPDPNHNLAPSAGVGRHQLPGRMPVRPSRQGAAPPAPMYGHRRDWLRTAQNASRTQGLPSIVSLAKSDVCVEHGRGKK